jgi:hypothetical protein
MAGTLLNAAAGPDRLLAPAEHVEHGVARLQARRAALDHLADRPALAAARRPRTAAHSSFTSFMRPRM